MVRLDVEKEGRNHGDSFLARDVADIGLVNEEVLELFELVLLANCLTRSLELPCESVRVPMPDHRVSKQLCGAQKSYEGAHQSMGLGASRACPSYSLPDKKGTKTSLII